MNLSPHSSNMRSFLSDEFARLQARALRSSLWPSLNGRKTRPVIFPEAAPEKSPNRRFLGTMEIPLEQVIGTLNRRDDFDDQFRPLKPSLKERWVNAYLSLQTDGWEPVLVHKVGDSYYVEDGHHRVSVARFLGMQFLEARVWDYPVQEKALDKCYPAPCREVCPAGMYAGVTK